MKSKLLLLAMALGAVLLDYFFPLDVSGQQIYFGGVIGALITGAAVVTTFSGRTECDSFLVFGDVDTAMPLSGIQVEIDGAAKINLTGSQPLVSAFAKYMMNVAGTVNGMVLKIATGNIAKKTTYKFTNNGATTPNIMAFSDAANGYPVEVATKGIQPLDYADFSLFSALLITPSANVLSIDIDYMDGHRESGLTVIEVDSMLAMNSATQTDGRLDAVVTTIDNRPILGRPIRTVRVNATTAVTVAIVKLGDADFANAKASNQI